MTLTIVVVSVIAIDTMRTRPAEPNVSTPAPEDIAQMAEHVVRLVGSSNCTGVLLSDLTVLTAAHCVDRALFDAGDQVTTFPDGRKSFRVGARILVEYDRIRYHIRQVTLPKGAAPGSFDYERDVALLLLSTPLNAPHVSVKAPGSGLYTTYVAFGFQRSGPDKIWHLESCLTKPKSEGRVLTGSCSLTKGASGGPLLYRERGIVYTGGVLSTASPKGSNTWVGTASIAELLREGTIFTLKN